MADALRTWGLVATAAALSSALTIVALTSCDSQIATEPHSEPPPSAAATSAPVTTAAEAPIIAEPAEAVATPATAPQTLAAVPARARPSFVVRFVDPHPLARAQAIAASGRVAEGRRAAIAAINGQANLRGLCFDRFTVGAAEIVLAACQPVEGPDAYRARWLRRLNAMRGVEYAEANAVAQPEVRRAP